MNKMLSAQPEDWSDNRVSYLKPYDTSMYIKVLQTHRSCSLQSETSFSSRCETWLSKGQASASRVWMDLCFLSALKRSWWSTTSR